MEFDFDNPCDAIYDDVFGIFCDRKQGHSGNHRAVRVENHSEIIADWKVR